MDYIAGFLCSLTDIMFEGLRACLLYTHRVHSSKCLTWVGNVLLSGSWFCAVGFSYISKLLKCALKDVQLVENMN